jgi:uncharacterized RDD family membrane protein YckC
MKTPKVRAQYLAIKQAIAFSIDLALVSLPLIIAPSIEIFPLFALLWFLYIPLGEYYFTQTVGMKIMGTHIVNANDRQSRVPLGTVLRRQIARIGMMWGVIGWLFMFVGKQYVSDYAIVDDNYSSIEPNVDGWVEVHKNNEYKVIFFVLFLMLLFSIIKDF